MVYKQLKLICFFCSVFIAIFFYHNNSEAWWFSKDINQRYAEAIRENSAQKLAKCLEQAMSSNNYSMVLQIRSHARKNIQIVRNHLVMSHITNPRIVENKLDPWVAIDKKAQEFFQRKHVVQKGKNDPASLYHR